MLTFDRRFTCFYAMILLDCNVRKAVYKKLVTKLFRTGCKEMRRNPHRIGEKGGSSNPQFGVNKIRVHVQYMQA